MMSRTSSLKFDTALGMFKFTLRKNLGLVILISAAVLLICPGYFLSHTNEFLNNFVITEEGMRNNDSVIAISAILTLIGAGSVVLFNLINFMFLYSKRSGDVFHALPVTRSGMIISRCAAGYVFSLIPVTLGYLSQFILALCFNLRFSPAKIAVMYLLTLVIMLVCSAVSMLFVVCAGTPFDLFISFIGLNVGVLIVSLILEDIFENALAGYTSGSSIKIMEWVSPFVYCGSGFADYIDLGKVFTTSTLIYIIRCLVYVAVFGIVSVLLYKKRKAERGGEAYAFKFIYIVCSIAFAFCGGYLLGVMFSGGELNAIFWVFAAAGAVLTAVAYGAVSERGFKSYKSFIINGLVGAVLLGSVFVAVKLGGFGYTNRIPAEKEIESVSIHLDNSDIDFKNPEKVLKLHKAIVDNKAYSNTPDENIRYVRFEYDLNGKELNREFAIDFNKAAKEIAGVLKSEERFDTVIERYRNDRPKDVEVSFYSDIKIVGYDSGESGEPIGAVEDTYQSFTAKVSGDDFMQLIKAYREDVLSISDKDIIKERVAESTVTIGWEAKNGYVYYNTLVCGADYTKTLECIENLTQKYPSEEF